MLLRMKSILLLLAVALIGLAAPSALAAPKGQVDEIIFYTPSKNIRCDGWWYGRSTEMNANTVQWTLMSTMRDDPGGYMNDLPSVYRLSVRGSSSISRADWMVPLGRGAPYGTTLNVGWIRCVSRYSGLTCKGRISGHGFFLSRETQRTF